MSGVRMQVDIALLREPAFNSRAALHPGDLHEAGGAVDPPAPFLGLLQVEILLAASGPHRVRMAAEPGARVQPSWTAARLKPCLIHLPPRFRK
jgi:hypothetical protein